jgi:hypothetical protein
LFVIRKSEYDKTGIIGKPENRKRVNTRLGSTDQAQVLTAAEDEKITKGFEVHKTGLGTMSRSNFRKIFAKSQWAQFISGTVFTAIAEKSDFRF